MKRLIYALLLFCSYSFAQNECTNLGLQSVSSETFRDNNGVLHQVECYDPATNTKTTTVQKTFNGNILAKAVLTTYNNVSLVSNGIPTLVAKFDATVQAANITQATLYAVPSNGVGFYRVSCYTVITQAATTSSTLPSCQTVWTDNDTNLASQDDGSGFTCQLGTNTVGTNTSQCSVSAGSLIINVKASTNISYVTSGYASVGGTPMQYAAHFKLEYLGN